jgi:Fe-S cluster assembly ATPase SufC
MRAQHEAERQRAEADHARTLEALESAWAHVRTRNEFLERALLEAFSPGLARRADPSQPSPVKPIVGPDADDEPDAEDGVEMPPV